MEEVERGKEKERERESERDVHVLYAIPYIHLANK